MIHHSSKEQSATTKEAGNRPPPPEPPEDEECCNNGCEALCVFEIYKMQKADYEAKWGNNEEN